MSTLERPEIRPPHEDGWGAWTVDAGYYGARRSGLCWVIESIKPNTEESAHALLRIHNIITDRVRGREQGKVTGLLAAVLPQPKDDYRLRAERTPAGWLISEYDFNLWKFLITDKEDDDDD